MRLLVPTVKVEAAFGTPRALADPSTMQWTDISPWVKGFDTTAGRFHELQRFEPGTLSLTLDNRDGRFSPANIGSPYNNLLPAVDADFQSAGEESVGDWIAYGTANCVPVPADLSALGGGTGMALLGAAAGVMEAGIPVAAGLLSPVIGGQTYTALASFRSPTTPNTVQVGIQWFDSTLTAISTGDTSGTDSTSSWTSLAYTAVAPSTAVYAQLIVWATCTGPLDGHYVRQCGVFTGSDTTWYGSGALTPATPTRATATWSAVDYLVFYGLMDTWAVDTTTIMGSDITVQATDLMKLLSLGNLNTGCYFTEILGDGPRAYWRFGDPIGSSVAADSSGNSFTGTCIGNPTFGVGGALLTDPNTAIEMGTGSAGAGSVLVDSGVIANMGTAAWSFETWMQTTTSGALQILIDNNYGFQSIGVSSTGVVELTANGSVYYGSVTVGNSAWHHIVVTFDGVSTTKLYVDGNADTLSGSPTWVTTTNDFMIGNDLGLASPMWGAMDETATYPAALTAAQVATHYSIGAAGYALQDSGARIAAILTVGGVSSALLAIDTGLTTCAGIAQDLSTTPTITYAQQIEATEQGFLYFEDGKFIFHNRHYPLTNSTSKTAVATISSTGTGLPMLPGMQYGDDDLDLWNSVLCQRQSSIPGGPPGVPQIVQDKPSIYRYGQRDLTGYDSMVAETDIEMQNLGQWLISHYAQPVNRVAKVSLGSEANQGANLPTMLGAKMLDRITTIWQPANQEVPAEADALIEGYEHHYTVDRWVTDLSLSPAETQPYWIVEDPEYGLAGVTTRAAY